MKPRLLADENASHKLITACQRLRPGFPIDHIAAHNKAWLGLDDHDLLDACLEAGMIVFLSKSSPELGPSRPFVGPIPRLVVNV